MTVLYATYCSAEKRLDEQMLPAIQRYRSVRIESVAGQAAQEHARFAILSGSFGLVPPEHPLPYYDHLLSPDDVPTMIPRVVETLQAWAIVQVRWFTVSTAQDPNVAAYAAVMEGACAAIEVEMNPVIVDIP